MDGVCTLVYEVNKKFLFAHIFVSGSMGMG